MEEIESKPNEILTATESKLQEHNISALAERT